MTRVSSALVRVTPVPNRREANASVAPRGFGRTMVTAPVVVLTVVGQCPSRHTDRTAAFAAAGDSGGALVAGVAEERVHLGLDGGLDDQAGAEAGDVFHDLDQIPAFGEQRADLGADGLNGR